MSPTTKLVTSALKMTLNGMGDVFHGLVTPGALIVVVGLVLLNVNVYVLETELLLSARSCALLAGTLTVTAPLTVGVRLKVYTVGLTITKPPRAAVVGVTVMSPSAKPVTFSLKVAVNRTGVVAVVPPLETLSELMTTVGGMRSEVRIREGSASVLSLPARSVHIPSSIATVTTRLGVGVTLNVNIVSALLTRSATVPLVTWMSASSKPVTVSLKLAVTAMGEAFVGFWAAA
jgi:hypothetical protein